MVGTVVMEASAVLETIPAAEMMVAEEEEEEVMAASS